MRRWKWATGFGKINLTETRRGKSGYFFMGWLRDLVQMCRRGRGDDTLPNIKLGPLPLRPLFLVQPKKNSFSYSGVSRKSKWQKI